MRSFLCIFAALALASCARGDPSEVTLEVGKVSHVDGCNVFLHEALGGEPVLALVGHVCDVPESFTKEKNWWGEGQRPLCTGISVGDCLRFGKKVYCMEEMDPGKSVTLKATYENLHDRRFDHLRPIR
ncbi:hypothetical protein [Polyangium sorediatum]|uniref:Lipoprotein n=1 Tax=Polyangium sorediatum TaxID=889274 RepID=A0ABT6P482_9BACT|nr:hypothetical protein [Polyangium sorediatum]MDI1435417.1 hypothetical protein [Polyangium sorediatum]